jgi:hypothetical protein
MSGLPPGVALSATLKQDFGNSSIMVNDKSESSPVTLRNGDRFYVLVCSQDPSGTATLDPSDIFDLAFGADPCPTCAAPPLPPAPLPPVPPPPNPNAPGGEAFISFFFFKNGLAPHDALPLEVLELPTWPTLPSLNMSISATNDDKITLHACGGWKLTSGLTWLYNISLGLETAPTFVLVMALSERVAPNNTTYRSATSLCTPFCEEFGVFGDGCGRRCAMAICSPPTLKTPSLGKI